MAKTMSVFKFDTNTLDKESFWAQHFFTVEANR